MNIIASEMNTEVRSWHDCLIAGGGWIQVFFFLQGNFGFPYCWGRERTWSIFTGWTLWTSGWAWTTVSGTSMYVFCKKNKASHLNANSLQGFGDSPRERGRKKWTFSRQNQQPGKKSRGGSSDAAKVQRSRRGRIKPDIVHNYWLMSNTVIVTSLREIEMMSRISLQMLLQISKCV